MRTIVLQSFRTRDVPAWLQSCMSSVLGWSLHNGWEYCRSDDGFFDLAPDWVRERCGDAIHCMTDVCRLVWMRQKLSSGYDRVVWADADILVFSPGQLDISCGGGYGFAHELFLKVQPSGRIKQTESINNSLLVFENAGLVVLDRYLATCLEALRKAASGPIPRTALLPDTLGGLFEKTGPQKVYGVGLFGLSLMSEIAVGGGDLAREYVKRVPRPLAAANLCHFLRNAAIPEARPHFDSIYKAAVDRLVSTRGAVLA